MISEADITAAIGQLSNLFVSLKFKQLAAIRRIEGQPWTDVKYDAKHAGVVQSMLKILRMAALMKYIMQYPRMHKSNITMTQKTRYSIGY
jgi:hypothetical protein